MRPLDGVRLLWCADRWDGPVSGLASYEGRDCWFEAVFDDERDDYGHPRRYVLRELTPAQRDREWACHRLFEEKVGTHTCLHDGAPPRGMAPPAAWDEFYAAYPPIAQSRYRDNPVVGWFTADPARS